MDRASWRLARRMPWFVGEKVGVEVGGRGKIEGALEEDLAGSGFEEVAAADYFGDVRCRRRRRRRLVGSWGDRRPPIVANALRQMRKSPKSLPAVKDWGPRLRSVKVTDVAVGNSKTVVGGGFEGVRWWCGLGRQWPR